MSLDGKVALITGGSRGAGRGIAIELGKAGAIVYVTGRSRRGEATTQYETNTLDHTVRMVEEEGGKAIAITCDHSDEVEIQKMVDQVVKDQNRIDILVNNIWAGYTNQEDQLKIPNFTDKFWDQPIWRWDKMFTVSLRSHFITSKLVVPHMIKQRSGLVVTTGFWDDDKYLSNLPYDVVKMAKNRMMYGMAIELKEFNVAAVALGLGWIRTEHIHELYNVDDYSYIENEELEKTESTRYGGRGIVAMATDPDVMRWTGKIVTSSELAEEYNFTDLDGTQPERFIIPDPIHGISQR